MKRNPWLVWLLAGASFAGLAALASSDARAGQPKGSARRADAERWLAAAQELTGVKGLADFGAAVADGESDFSATAHNGSPKERAAAARGFVRNLEAGRWAGNEFLDSEVWTSGSWGWFGLLPSTALAAPGLTVVDPALLTRGDAAAKALQLAAWVELLYRLSRYDAVQTWGDMRAGMASLDVLFADHPKTVEKLRARLESLGLDPALADAKPDFAGYRSKFADGAALYVALWEKHAN